MAMASRAGPRFGATCNWARFLTQPASANAPSMNTGRPSRPTTIPRARSRNAADTCKSLTSGKKEAEREKMRPAPPGEWRYEPGGNDLEHKVNSLECQVRLWTLFLFSRARMVAGLCPVPHNLSLEPVKSLAALLAVAVQSILDDGIRFGCRLNFVYLDRLALQLLVVLKKAAQHDQPVRRH